MTYEIIKFTKIKSDKDGDLIPLFYAAAVIHTFVYNYSVVVFNIYFYHKIKNVLNTINEVKYSSLKSKHFSENDIYAILAVYVF